jgi:hypothetical protein
MEWTIEKLHAYNETICDVIKESADSCKGCNHTKYEIDNCYNDAVKANKEFLDWVLDT